MLAGWSGRIQKGDVVVIRYEGPKGGPGMPEMLTPTSAIMGAGLGKDVALMTDGRFSGGSHGFIVGHITPEAQEGGPIALVRTATKSPSTPAPIGRCHLIKRRGARCTNTSKTYNPLLKDVSQTCKEKGERPSTFRLAAIGNGFHSPGNHSPHRPKQMTKKGLQYSLQALFRSYQLPARRHGLRLRAATVPAI
jgi:hypothetical protein